MCQCCLDAHPLPLLLDEHLRSQQKMRMAEAQRTKRRVAPDERSTQQGRPSLENTGAAPESQPGMKTEAQASEPSLSKTPSTELSESSPGSQIWDKVRRATWSPTSWVSEAQGLEARAAKARAWEAQAFEAQSRASQSKQNSVLRMIAAPLAKRKHLPEKLQVPEKEKSKVLFTRPVWSNKVEYILAQVGYSVRPGDLWHFTFLWLHNGGCSFLLIYIFMMFLIGIPLLFLEMAAGQRLRRGSIDVWKLISPWIGGVGYTSFLVCFIGGLYLNVVNAWTLSYLSQSFQFHLPWEKCPLVKNSTDFDPECAQTTPSMYFWYRLTLKASDRIEDGGPPVLSLSLSLLVAWCLVAAFMINGLKSTGKVMYLLVPVPYLIVLCLLIRSLLLDGAVFGLRHLASAKISAMYNMNVWCRAGTQVLFALGLGFGPVVAISSHMHPSNNCLHDAFLVALVNLVTMLLFTPFFFSLLGFRATVITQHCSEKSAEILMNLVATRKLPPEAQPPLNLFDRPTSIFTSWLKSLPHPIKSMVLSHVPECSLEQQFLKVKEGPSFAFLAVTETMSFIPGSVFWSILFFLMLLILELSTTIGNMQGIITPLQDTFSCFRKYTKLLTVVVFVLMFLCGLFFIRPSGIYFFKLLTEYWIVLPIIIIVIFENMAVAWAYGARRFLADFAILWDRPISPIIRWLWCCLSPILLLVLLVTTLIHLFLKSFTYVAWDSSTSKEVLRQYPSWGLLAMIALVIIGILPIPTYFVYCLTHGIPFNVTSWHKSRISSRCLPLSVQLSPIKEVQSEEILQDDN
nr:PREDICTED: orphan sodium- and chloride-dependent neurotransmitter transporter NTT5 isoform X1 [Equus przewalskii]XP_008522022.1 PREDICTED: orphan sodium- and chloride-dependent neurotransmitter transporter NTT5 isoform X1 [Equus przewalskii]XP_008522023.1 PREDICTED: orphan sodium- and chloride-dependent neurotransmitter transporter NTT5 isoform X1 [Equus przewalskii]